MKPQFAYETAVERLGLLPPEWHMAQSACGAISIARTISDLLGDDDLSRSLTLAFELAHAMQTRAMKLATEDLEASRQSPKMAVHD